MPGCGSSVNIQVWPGVAFLCLSGDFLRAFPKASCLQGPSFSSSSSVLVPPKQSLTVPPPCLPCCPHPLAESLPLSLDPVPSPTPAESLPLRASGPKSRRGLCVCDAAPGAL